MLTSIASHSMLARGFVLRTDSRSLARPRHKKRRGCAALKASVTASGLHAGARAQPALCIDKEGQAGPRGDRFPAQEAQGAAQNVT